MKLPAWDHTLQRWDQFKAFHIGIDKVSCTANEMHHYRPPNFIMFDTGELIFTCRRTSPWDRGQYGLLNLSLYRTIDVDCPRLYTAEGEPIPKAQLNYKGSQLIIIDHDLNRAFNAGWPYVKDGPETMPARFRGSGYPSAPVWWPGQGQPPVPKLKLTASPPDKGTTPAELEHVRTIHAVVRAALTLDDQHPAHEAHRTRWFESKYEALPFNDVLAASSMTDLSDEQLSRLYRFGVQRKRLEFDYLLTERP